MKRTNPDFINGIPELLILQLLALGPMHGYEIVQAIKRRSDGVFSFGEGCVYPILHRLVADSIVSSRRALVAGRSRVVYEITAKGQKRLTQGRNSWKRVATAVGKLLDGGGASGTPVVD
jgi:PadR family transcriptional regulator PadR